MMQCIKRHGFTYGLLRQVSWKDIYNTVENQALFSKALAFSQRCLYPYETIAMNTTDNLQQACLT